MSKLQQLAKIDRDLVTQEEREEAAKFAEAQEQASKPVAVGATAPAPAEEPAVTEPAAS